MGKIKTFCALLKHNPKLIYKSLINNLTKSSISHIFPDATYLKIQYRAIFGKRLNLKSPKSFNEKLQWLKLFDRNDEYITMVDKLEAKSYVSKMIGEEYIIPTLGVWDTFDEIDFDQLPEKFVLKCTHDSGSTIICRDKATFDIEAARQKLTSKLKSNLFWHGREWPYKSLKPRIIAEQYMTFAGDAPEDYKFFCFNGKVKCFKIDYDRFKNHRANYYSPDGSLLRFGEVVCPPDFERELPMPQSLKKMIEFSELLSKNKPFLRVDFYEVEGKIYFGELTFFPAAGFGPFEPEEWDETLGSWITLPTCKDS